MKSPIVKLLIAVTPIVTFASGVDLKVTISAESKTLTLSILRRIIALTLSAFLRSGRCRWSLRNSTIYSVLRFFIFTILAFILSFFHYRLFFYFFQKFIIKEV
ncbi:hypothetical protein THII_2124 [Thioploca ingrica]|uniref:Uncharacterized protein n=1 Tax=Thioploca ingrica TaxID=40754 RepID=A0A090BV86_9GAMM|nr:hypothetical protein THII_2124 [Thioploca ingrica]